MRAPTPWRRWRAPLVVMLLLLAGVGCGQGTPAGQGDPEGTVEVLAKADGWRDGLQEAADHTYAVIEIAREPDVAQRAWEDNVPAELPEAEGRAAAPGVHAALDSVDLTDRAVVVYSSGESGTCPTWVEDLDTVEGRLEVRLGSAADEGQPCTDDFRPYRLVLAVDRDALPAPDDLPVEQVDVPSENLTDVAARVEAYPLR